MENNNKHLPLRDGVTVYDKNFDKFSMYEKANCIWTTTSAPLKWTKPTDSTIPGLAEYPPEGTHTVSSTTLLPTSSTEVRPVKISQLPPSIQPTYARLPMIDKVIFNPPATIVLWKDGTKTVVKTSKDDVFSMEMGLAMAIAKRYFGSRSKFLKAVDNAEGEVLEARHRMLAHPRYPSRGEPSDREGVSIGEALCSPIAAK